MADPNYAAAYLEQAEDALRDKEHLYPAEAIKAALNIGVAIAISLQEAVDVLREINEELAPPVELVREPIDPEGPRPPSVGDPVSG